MLREVLNPEALLPGEGFGINGLDNEAYHSGPGLSMSGAKRLLVSPFHYHALTQPRTVPPKAPTPALVNGTLVHCMVLEPGEFDKRYVVGPDVDRRTKEWKTFLCGVPGGVEVITQLQLEAACRQAHALRALPAVAELLAEGVAEQSIYWRDPAHGLLLKCRPDWRSPVQHGRGAILLDVKTAADASPEGFAKACAAFGYYMQDPWYCEGVQTALGIEVHGMVFAVVESEFPHACAAYMLSDEARALGRERIARARLLYRDCTAANTWPGYAQDIQVIDLPRWAYSAGQS